MEQLENIRENLVNTAVKFLQNPKVSGSPQAQKQDFLRQKGLTEQEIQRACDLAAPALAAAASAIACKPDYVVNIPGQYGQVVQVSWFYKVKESLNNMFLFAATCYCVYWLYKKFISPLLFERNKDPPKDPVMELDENIKSVKETIIQVKSDIQLLTQNQADQSVSQLVQDLKQDLASLKSLLLSRKQFPSAPASIPSWQLEATNQSREKTTEREDDAGSGSSTNNSDSSLEMIREDPPKE